jgi:ectoine hydroxylase-related dioxygenase (phytanoyl-CoA dioxygenase family)
MSCVDETIGVPHAGAAATSADLVVMLREAGCVVVDALVPVEMLTVIADELRALAADAPLGDNSFDGLATRRIFDPFARTRVLDELILDPLVGAVVEDLIGPFQFGMTVLSEVGPGESAQRLHRDQAVYPLPLSCGPVEVNTIWAIDDFTEENGATLVAPGTHLRDKTPGSSWATVPVEMEAGSVLIYDGRTVHGAGANKSGISRLGLIVEHVVRWLRPADNHTVAIGPDLASRLPVALQERLGFNQHGRFLGSIAGRPPGEWLENPGSV